MIAEFARIAGGMDRSSARVPWLLVAGSAMLALLVFYVFFAAYLPAKQRIARLEAEIKDVYAREAALQTQLAQQEQRASLRERQLAAERDALARRLETPARENPPRRRR
jgi:type II secretory pathway component PulM